MLPIILSVDTANRVFVVLLSLQSLKGILSKRLDSDTASTVKFGFKIPASATPNKG